MRGSAPVSALRQFGDEFFKTTIEGRAPATRGRHLRRSLLARPFGLRLAHGYIGSRNSNHEHQHSGRHGLSGQCQSSHAEVIRSALHWLAEQQR